MLRRIVGPSSVPTSTRTLATPLSQFAPFAGLDPSIVGELEAHTTIVQLEPGDTLFKQGDPGDALYIVVTGRLEMHIEQAAGPPHVLAKVLPGECLGEMALLARQPRTAIAKYAQGGDSGLQATRHPSCLLDPWRHCPARPGLAVDRPPAVPELHQARRVIDRHVVASIDRAGSHWLQET